VLKYKLLKGKKVRDFSERSGSSSLKK